MAVFLAGIPWLGGIALTVVTSIIGFFATYLGKKVAGVVGVVVAVAAAFGVFYAVITGSLLGIGAVMPPMLSEGLALVMPPNAAGCVSAIVTAKIARAVYSYQLFIGGQLSFKF